MFTRNFDTIKRELDSTINAVKFDSREFSAAHCYYLLGKADTVAGFAQSLGLYDLAEKLRGYELTMRELCIEAIKQEGES